MSTEPSPAFPGADELVRRLDLAVQEPDVPSITESVQHCLEELIAANRLELPSELRRGAADCYARRLLYRSPEHGYAVIAMIWGERQGTPVHDHAGVWCVEAVLEGEIDVTQYDLREEDEGRCRFDRQETVRAGVGDAGRLIPPFEYHTIANALEGRPSITVHVYGEELRTCTIFTGGEGGWYERVEKQLGYTA